MTCATIQPRLDEWRDGTLDPVTAAVVETHLKSCSACREELAFCGRIHAEAAALPPSLDPPVDLWPGIEAAVTRRGSRRLIPWLAAAVIVLLVGAGIIASRLDRTGENRASEPAITMEEDYRAAAADLQRTVATRRAALGPVVSGVVERNIRIADEAIAEITLALESDPGDPHLTRMLWSVYDHKLDLLRRAAAATTET